MARAGSPDRRYARVACTTETSGDTPSSESQQVPPMPRTPGHVVRSASAPRETFVRHLPPRRPA